MNVTKACFSLLEGLIQPHDLILNLYVSFFDKPFTDSQYKMKEFQEFPWIKFHIVFEELWVLFNGPVDCFRNMPETSKWTGSNWNHCTSLPLSPNEILRLSTWLNGHFKCTVLIELPQTGLTSSWLSSTETVHSSRQRCCGVSQRQRKEPHLKNHGNVFVSSMLH